MKHLPIKALEPPTPPMKSFSSRISWLSFKIISVSKKFTSNTCPILTLNRHILQYSTHPPIFDTSFNIRHIHQYLTHPSIFDTSSNIWQILQYSLNSWKINPLIVLNQQISTVILSVLLVGIVARKVHWKHVGWKGAY